MTPSRRLRGDLLLAIVIIAFAVSLVAGFDRMIGEEKQRTAQQGKESWLAVQAEIELLKLQHTLDRYAIGDGSVARDELQLQFDVFWSRLSLLTEGEESARLREAKGVGRMAASMLRDLARIEDMITSVSPTKGPDYYRVREVIDAMRVPLHGVMQATLLQDRQVWAADGGGADAAFSELAIYFIGILVAGAVLIVVLLHENRRARTHLQLARSAETLASEARGRLEDAIEAISEGFLLCDRNDRILLFNRRYQDQIHGGKTNIAVGVRFEDGVRDALDAGIIDTGDMSKEEWLAWRMASHCNPGPAQEVRTHAGIWLHVNEYRTREGGTVSLYGDVTELRRREDALRSAKEDAELANRSKSDFLANISHELRTPLNAIIGFADMLVDGVIGDLATKQREYVVDIRASGHHLLEIINDILDLSKAEAGRLTLDERPFDLTRSIEGAVRLVKPRAAAEGVSVTVEKPPRPVGLMADELKLRQIVLNLLSNAVKFTPSGGSITVRIGEGPPPAEGIEVRGRPVVPGIEGEADDAGGSSAHGAGRSAKCLLLSVTDTGIGMSVDEVHRALQPFVQVDSGLNRKYQGTGLGLPLTRRLAELHGGSLMVHSVPGAGTRVTLVLPAARIVSGATAGEGPAPGEGAPAGEGPPAREGPADT